jgi:hypothetical protein
VAKSLLEGIIISGKILLDYDYDKIVPAYGLGAKVKHPTLNTENKAHHCFPINCNIENPNIFQLD